jgi:hypothetical protein
MAPQSPQRDRSALNVCFNDISWIIRKIYKCSFIYGPNKKWLESTKMSKTGDKLYGIARSYKDRAKGKLKEIFRC